MSAKTGNPRKKLFVPKRTMAISTNVVMLGYQGKCQPQYLQVFTVQFENKAQVANQGLRQDLFFFRHHFRQSDFFVPFSLT